MLYQPIFILVNLLLRHFPLKDLLLKLWASERDAPQDKSWQFLILRKIDTKPLRTSGNMLSIIQWRRLNDKAWYRKDHVVTFSKSESFFHELVVPRDESVVVLLLFLT